MDRPKLEFPAVERIVFESSPLREVVCQLRFNAIFAINQGPLAAFQDRIRKQFPVANLEEGLKIDIKSPQPILTTNTPTWRFSTEDRNWSISLTNTFIAFTTTAYDTFCDYWSRLAPVLEVFQEVYSPPFYTRVGLRFVNRIILEREGDERIDWSEILNERISGEYRDPVLRTLIKEAKHYVVLSQDRGLIGWRYSRDLGKAEGSEAERFTLDFDHFVDGQVNVDEVPELLHTFDQNVYRLFVWCFTKEGIEFLKPVKR